MPCNICGKAFPGEPLWAVIRPGEEWKYICQCRREMYPHNYPPMIDDYCPCCGQRRRHYQTYTVTSTGTNTLSPQDADASKGKKKKKN